jgi:3-hydroxy-9,10-secoandrosta-1,3,5(10)-triene-9,17-dione monooxygenase reductase component
MTQLSTVLDPVEFKQFMACWSTGVAVVTSAAADRTPIGCTVNAITSVSVTPPLLLVSLAERSRTLAAIQARQRLGVNLLPARRADLARRFAGGDPPERFAGVEHDWAVGVPVLAEVVTSAVCVLRRCVNIADHVLVVAEPVWWKPVTQQAPLVSFDRGYWSLWSMAFLGKH